MKDAQQIIDRIRALMDEHEKQLSELEHSIELEKRFPGCFDDGPCSPTIKSVPPHRIPEDYTITVSVRGEDTTVSGKDDPGFVIQALRRDHLRRSTELLEALS